MFVASGGDQPSGTVGSRDGGSDAACSDSTDLPRSTYPYDHPIHPSPTLFGSKRRASGDGDAPFQDVMLWVPDGNVVFIAKDTAFKVHTGTIGRQQEPFLTPLKANRLEQESDHDPIEGCPVVMVEDSAHDFRHLLRIIYDGFDYFLNERTATFSDFASAARLAHKYEMPSILTEAKKRMTPLFPTESQTWSDNTSLRAAVLKENDPIEAVNLFRALQWDNMLPAALYLACQLPARTLLLGAPRADGTLEKLRAADVERCVNLHRACVEASVAAHDAVFPVEGKNRCGGWFRGCHARMATEGLRVRDMALHGDPLGETLRLELERIAGSSGEKICATCLEAARQTERTHRQDFWCSLPDRVAE